MRPRRFAMVLAIAGALATGCQPATNNLSRPVAQGGERSSNVQAQRYAAEEQRALDAIAAELDACLSRAAGDAVEIQDCHFLAIRAINGRLSTSSEDLLALLRNLFEPLLFSGGHEDALVERVAVVTEYASFMRRRAAILLGIDNQPREAADRRSLSKLLSSLGPRDRSDQPFMARWAAIRDADCRVYAVPNCVERLDAALLHMTSELANR